VGDKLLYVGGFCAAFGGFLWLKGPAVNSAQFAFRVGLLVIGLIVAGVGLVMKSKAR
jgi:hypothetical protein